MEIDTKTQIKLRWIDHRIKCPRVQSIGIKFEFKLFFQVSKNVCLFIDNPWQPLKPDLQCAILNRNIILFPRYPNWYGQFITISAHILSLNTRTIIIDLIGDFVLDIECYYQIHFIESFSRFEGETFVDQ